MSATEVDEVTYPGQCGSQRWHGSHRGEPFGLEPIMVPGSHEALLTHPDDVARAVLTAADTLDLRRTAARN